jgi:hypothetical protein
MQRLNPAWQPVSFSQLYTVSHVSADDVSAGVGVQLIMRVDAIHLILCEKLGAHGLSDVVIKCSHTRQERIGANNFGGLFSQVSNDQRVVIGPWRLKQQATLQWVRWLGQLEQL